MTEFKPGDEVIYRPYPESTPEEGIVTQVVDGGYIFVLYRGDVYPKATQPKDLTKVMR